MTYYLLLIIIRTTWGNLICMIKNLTFCSKKSLISKVGMNCVYLCLKNTKINDITKSIKKEGAIYEELDNNAHSVFLMHYHLVLVVKYRRKVFDDRISDRAKEIFEYILPKYNITLQEWNHNKDHVHILFKAHPNTEIKQIHKRIQKCEQ